VSKMQVVDSAEMKSEGNLSITILLEKSFGSDDDEFYDVILVFRNPKSDNPSLPILRLVDLSSASPEQGQGRFDEVVKGLHSLDRMEIDPT